MSALRPFVEQLEMAFVVSQAIGATPSYHVLLIIDSNEPAIFGGFPIFTHW